MKKITVLCLSLLFASQMHADEQLRQVQQSLKDQGFYYGVVDGEAGSETDAAVRRYQIRNGLEVTGKLNAETLSALHVGGTSAPTNEVGGVHEATQPPDATPPPSIVQSDKNFLRQQAPAVAPDSAPAPELSVPPEQVARVPAPMDISGIFRKTPYEQAPAVVQRDTLKRAQIRLAREGFFRGEIDGVVSAETEKAIVRYQRYADLRPTGRLDLDTLADMDLLPSRRAYVDPAPVPRYEEDEPVVVPSRRVYRGIWVH